MKLKLFLIFLINVIILFVLNGCATSANYQRKINTYLGHPQQDLLTQWGIPNQILHLHHHTSIYCYSRQGSTRLPTWTSSNFQSGFLSNGMYYGSSSGHQTFGGERITLYCQTCFWINNDQIIYKITTRGNGCLSY